MFFFLCFFRWKRLARTAATLQLSENTNNFLFSTSALQAWEGQLDTEQTGIHNRNNGIQNEIWLSAFYFCRDWSVSRLCFIKLPQNGSASNWLQRHRHPRSHVTDLVAFATLFQALPKWGACWGSRKSDTLYRSSASWRLIEGSLKLPLPSDKVGVWTSEEIYRMRQDIWRVFPISSFVSGPLFLGRTKAIHTCGPG